AAPSEVAAVTAVVAIAMVAWLPGLSARFARLPIGYKSPDQIAKGSFESGGDTESVDFVKIGNQAKRGHELLLGLVAGCVGLVVPRKGVTPFWGRIFDMFDGLVLLSLVPLCLAVLDVYNKVRGLTGN